MAEDTKAPAAAPAPAPAPAPATVPLTPQQQAVSTANTVQKDAEAARANRTVERRSSSPLITNPAPPKGDEPEKQPENLPASTVAEMAAGRAALEKNKPVAEALEDARRRREAGETQVATNPVDNVTRTAEVSKKV